MELIMPKTQLDETGAHYLLRYAAGFFPMADHCDAHDIVWHNPETRAIMPIQGLHVSKSLRRAVLRHPYDIRINTDFPQVIRACAENRDFTWLNSTIQKAFIGLHEAGYAHSVECWKADGTLAGGVYGLALGSVFCGESMFSGETGASKIALVHLCARLAAGGFTLFDSQIYNDHTGQFGAYTLPRAAYLDLLQQALRTRADFSLSASPDISHEALVKDFLCSENIKKNLTIS